MFKTTMGDDFYFLFKHSFLKIKCAPFLLKIEKDHKVDDFKKYEIGENHFKIHLSKLVSNVFLTLRIMNLKTCFKQKLLILMSKHGSII
jgi:hypothetical protein